MLSPRRSPATPTSRCSSAFLKCFANSRRADVRPLQDAGRIPADEGDPRHPLDELGDYEPRYNVAPTTRVPVVTSSKGERTLEWMRWGLVPAWAKDLKVSYSTFNARAETVATKPAFRTGRR